MCPFAVATDAELNPGSRGVFIDGVGVSLAPQSLPLIQRPASQPRHSPRE